MKGRTFSLMCALLSLAVVSTAETITETITVPTETVDLPSGDTPLTLQGGKVVYVVRHDTTLRGRNGEAGRITGESALVVPENTTVFIRIDKDATLTCQGGDGASATKGMDGRRPMISEIKTNVYYGVTQLKPRFDFENQSASVGGVGGGGGGAGVELGSGSRLVLFGEGAMIAQGGKGGDAASGGPSERGAVYFYSWVGNNGDKIPPAKGAPWPVLSDCQVNDEDKPNLANFVSGIVDRADGHAWGWWCNGQPASGGGGGGGAGGGGAGIGSPGSNGAAGGAGGVTSENGLDCLDNDKQILAVSGASGVGADAVKDFSASVVVCLGGGLNAIPGDGGQHGASAEKTSSDCHTCYYYSVIGNVRVISTDYYYYFHLEDGQGGGGGGAGGKGALIGQGGGGGNGGQGGSSGGMEGAENTELTNNLQVVVGTNGVSGVRGGAASVTRVDLPVAVVGPDDGICLCSRMVDAVEKLDAGAIYGARIDVVGDVRGEQATVPCGTTVVVGSNGRFTKDLRYPYYKVVNPVDGDPNTYFYTVDESMIVPDVTGFVVMPNGDAQISFSNVWEGLYYRPLWSADVAVGAYGPTGTKIKAQKSGVIMTLRVPKDGERRFYRIGVSDNPGALGD